MPKTSRKKFRSATIVLLVILAVSSVFALVGLRNNSLKSQELYNELLVADEKGEGVAEALDNLRGYIYSHMNTAIGGKNGIYPPIQLKGTYERLLVAQIKQGDSAGQEAYEKAQSYCEARFGAGELRSGRVQCVEEYLNEQGAGAEDGTVKVSPDLYRFDFQPPLWSPDLAGFAIATALIAASLLVFRLLVAMIKRFL